MLEIHLCLETCSECFFKQENLFVESFFNASEDVTALWVTHRLEELEYADGALCMGNGKVVKQGDESSIMDFIRSRK